MSFAGEDCAAIQFYVGDWSESTWYDKSCLGYNHYICESPSGNNTRHKTINWLPRLDFGKRLY